MVLARFSYWLLLNVSVTCNFASGTDLLAQWYVLSH